MKPIRVMHFRREVPTGGGPESLIVDIARQIDRRRFEMSVTVFGPASPPSLSPSSSPPAATPLLEALAATGTPTHVLPARHRLDLRPVRHLARLLEEERIDILHSHDHRSNMIAYLAVRRRPTIQVATLHQPMRRYWWLWHWEALDEWVWPHFDRVLPVAGAIRQEIVQRHPKLLDRVVAVTNGVDLSRFRPGGRREEVRAEFEIPPGAILCVTIGRFLPDKGLPYLLEAARKVLDKRRDVYWLLAGRGPLEAELRAMAGRLGLGDRVIFAGFRTDVPDLVAAGDLVVVSSTCEGCSVAILEAMACGRAVVATRVGGTPEIIEDGYSGRIVEPRCPGPLAAAVMELAGDSGKREAMERRGMSVVRDRFSIQHMVGRYEQVYEELMSAHLCSRGDSGV